MSIDVGTSYLGVRSWTIEAMPHPRTREYRPLTPEWLADEIESAGDLDRARGAWRRFSNRISQTGEGTDLSPWWGDAVAVLRSRGHRKLAMAAERADRLERAAPRRRAPKTYREITDGQIADAVAAVGDDLDGVRRVWLRYRRNLGEAHQGDIVERWPVVLAALRARGLAGSVALASAAQRLELQARADAQRRRAVKYNAKRRAARGVKA